MDLRTIVKREDFISIFIDTTERYYRDVLKNEIKIFQKPVRGAKCLCINFLPSFIATFPASNGMKEALYGEFNIRGSKLKYLLGKFLVFSSIVSRGIFAWEKLWIYSAEKRVVDFYCSPCNRTIRYFDFENDVVDCVIKTGYNTELMENQLSFRKEYNYEFVPQIIAEGTGWYREAIMHGHALARVTSEMEYLQAKVEAIKKLGILVRDTLRICTVDVYIEIMSRQVELLMKKLDSMISKDTKSRLIKLITIIEAQLCKSSIQIPVALSHGDFQAGNIWVNKNGSIIIYDWETSAVRSVWYDPATLLLNLRNSIESFSLKRRIIQEDCYLVNDPRKIYSQEEKKIIYTIIVLEDFIFQLTELSQRMFGCAEASLQDIIMKYEKICGGMNDSIKE